MVRPPGDVGIVSMYLLWHCELKPPIVLISIEEVRVYIQLMRILEKGTPRWSAIEEDYLDGMGI